MQDLNEILVEKQPVELNPVEMEGHIQHPVCLVTGGNRGLGLAVCRLLASRHAKVILTARDEEAGERAAKELHSEGLAVDFQLLDVTRQSDIETIRTYVEDTYQYLHVLINNAAIGERLDGPITTVKTATVERTLATNCFAPLQLCQAFLPLLSNSGFGRIINVSSGAGAFSSAGKGIAAYRLSKMCLNAVTHLLAAELRNHPVSINAVCPGSMRTRMGGAKATREPEQGADTIVWLALKAPKDLSGNFIRDRQVIPW
jgi:NAD(P)-dependent dehydrogenase (short-subunit alcohol dehydrogenase family)